MEIERKREENKSLVKKKTATYEASIRDVLPITVVSNSVHWWRTQDFFFGGRVKVKI
jgi:hypothetical protein